MEKLRDGRNCLRGCGHSFENRRKTYFFHAIAYSLLFFVYAISDGPIILVKNSLSDV